MPNTPKTKEYQAWKERVGEVHQQLSGNSRTLNADTEPFSYFASHHDKTLSDEQAKALQKNQQHFIKSALKVVESVLDKKYVREDRVITGFYAVRSRELDELLNEAVEYAARVIQAPETFEGEQKAFFRKIYQAHIKDHEKLALEYMGGLVRFMLGVKHNLAFAQYIEAQKKPNYQFQAPVLGIKTRLEKVIQDFTGKKNAYAKREAFHDLLKQMAEISDQLCCPALNGNTKDFWDYVVEFFKQYPEQKELAGKIVSMQYVEEGKLDIVTMAQVLHWHTTGGKGQLFENFPRIKAALEARSIGWHVTVAKGGVNTQVPRTKPLYEAISNHRADAQAYLRETIRKRYSKGERLAVFLAGAGPAMATERPVLSALGNESYTFDITVTDVDASGLISMKTSQRSQTDEGTEIAVATDQKERIAGSHIRDVRYYDMNQAGAHKNTEKDKYDIASFAICAHQVTSGKNGPDIHARFLRALTEKVKVGGTISNPDAAKGVIYEVPFILGNITDREGYVPDSEELQFQEVAVVIDKDTIKIPYPLRQFVSEEPKVIVNPKERGHGVYNLNQYIIVALPRTKLEALQLDWDNKNYQVCDALVSGVEGNPNVTELQELVMEQIQAEKSARSAQGK